MLDPKLLRQDIDTVAERLKVRGYDLDVASFSSLESARKSVQTATEALQAERNTRSKAIGQAKAKGEDIEPLKAEVANLGDELNQKKAELEAIQSDLDAFLLSVPNLPDPSVPAGASEDDNEVVRVWGDPTTFDFETRDHVDLMGAPDRLDFEAAAKITGSRFVVMSGGLVRSSSSCSMSIPASMATRKSTSPIL